MNFGRDLAHSRSSRNAEIVVGTLIADTSITIHATSTVFSESRWAGSSPRGRCTAHTYAPPAQKTCVSEQRTNTKRHMSHRC
jgi:hypothetical protein